MISYLVAKENEIENYSKFLYFYLFIIYSLHRIPFNHSVLYEIFYMNIWEYTDHSEIYME